MRYLEVTNQDKKDKICVLIWWYLKEYAYLIISKLPFHIQWTWSVIWHPATQVNPLTAGAAYIQVFIYYKHIEYHLLKMVKIKCAINQQYLKTIHLHFVKSE